jgi:signal transduction histidine kinase
LLVTIVLLVGALLVRRQVREMEGMTAELAASHEHLEERIREANSNWPAKGCRRTGQQGQEPLSGGRQPRLAATLHALSLFAADLQRQARSGITQELPRLAEQIAASTTVLGELLDSLLDISRLDVAGIKPEIRAFPLQPIFERLAASFRRAAADRKIDPAFPANGSTGSKPTR